MTDYVLVFVTTGSLKEAEDIGYALVEERLAASVNILPAVRSILRWEGEIQREFESLLMVKTRRDVLTRLTERVQELHSYDTPEVIALPIEDGSNSYLHWLADQVPLPLAAAS